MIALISLFAITKYKEKKINRKTYSRAELIEKEKQIKVPIDWTPLPNIPSKVVITPNEKQTLESFILKELENSVKELEQKRIPFAKIDSNIIGNKFNPAVEEFLPKVRLNPLAQDFHPFH